MSGGGGVIIICGGLGRILGWVLLWLRRHEVLDLGIMLNRDALIGKGWTSHEVHLFNEIIDRDVKKWYHIAEHRGIEYHEDEPFPGNLTSPVVAEPYPIPPPPQ